MLIWLMSDDRNVPSINSLPHVLIHIESDLDWSAETKRFVGLMVPDYQNHRLVIITDHLAGVNSLSHQRCAFETWWMVLMVSQGEFRGWVPSNWPRLVTSRQCLLTCRLWILFKWEVPRHIIIITFHRCPAVNDDNARTGSSWAHTGNWSVIAYSSIDSRFDGRIGKERNTFHWK